MKKNGSGIEVYEASSRTSEDVTYTINVVDGQFWTCNCPAYIFKKSCRHQREMMIFYNEYKRRWRQ